MNTEVEVKKSDEILMALGSLLDSFEAEAKDQLSATCALLAVAAFRCGVPIENLLENTRRTYDLVVEALGEDEDE